MKKTLIILIILFTSEAFSQAPQGFNYQATVRDNNGDLLINQDVAFKFSIIIGASSNTPTYSETINLTTDDLGHINTIIGQGNPQSGQFGEINWSMGIAHLEIELDIGNGFVNLGTTQFLSVPFSMFSNKSGSDAKNKTFMYLSDGF